LDLPSSLFFSYFWTQMLHAFFIFLMYATCPGHHIFPNLITMLKSTNFEAQYFLFHKYTLYNKNQVLEIFLNQKWCKRTAGIIIPLIRNLLVFVCMWLFYTFH
jgi:hypothetical protein